MSAYLAYTVMAEGGSYDNPDLFGIFDHEYEADRFAAELRRSDVRLIVTVLPILHAKVHDAA